MTVLAPRSHFNELAKDGRLQHWRDAYLNGYVRVVGQDDILKLIGRVIERHESLFVQTVTALAQAVEMRDTYTGNHTQRVTAYALLLAEEMGLPEDVRRQLRVATLLHDIGKIAIDDQILRKPGHLSAPEFATFRRYEE